jgi:uncharacterized membrane protein YozB (DUF420 family)
MSKSFQKQASWEECRGLALSRQARRTYATAWTDRRLERAFFTTMPVAMAAVVFLGFSRTFFLRPWFPEAKALAAPEAVFYVHGILNTGWMALLIVQALLIRTRRIGLHRQLGIVGVVLAGAIVIVGSGSCLVAAHRPGGFIGVPIPPLQFLAEALPDMFLFGLFVGLAIVWRQNTQTHKRLMLLATINLLEAAIARIPLPCITNGPPLMARWLSDVFILLLVIWDLSTRRRLHPATFWGGLLIVASQPLRLMVGETHAWLTFAKWAVGLLN